MITLKPNSKQARAWYNAYRKSETERLDQCYTRWSKRKQLAYDYCIETMHNEKGSNLRILSYNSMQFTAGWTTFEGIRIETHNNSYLIPW